MPKFYIIQGTDKGHTFDVKNSPILIGRNSPDMPLTDNTISRRHAEVVKQDDTWVIRDLNSANGTYVNGVKISSPVSLKQGDQIRCGATLIVFDAVRNSVMGDLGGLHIDKDGNLVESAIMSTTPSMDDSVIMAGPETSNAVINLRILYEMSTAISSIFDQQQLLEEVMDMIFDNLPADRGFILLRENDHSELQPRVVRYRSPEHSSEIAISHTIVDYVIEHKEGVLCSNAMRDPRFAKGKSVQDYEIHSALCVPIALRNSMMGVIYVDTTVANHTYAGDQLRLLTAIGFQTGLALEHARLYETGVKAERLAAVGETVAYLSHGIKNILQGLQSASDLVEMGLNKNKIDMARKGWAILQRNLTRVQNLVLNMLAFSKDRQPQLAQTQLNHLINELIEMLSGQADDRHIGLIADLDENMPAIPLDADGIQQVILNLVLNAMDAVKPDKGMITIKTTYNANKNEVVLTVGDNGSGIDPDQIKEIFQAFNSSKGQGGTGLGLAVVKKIIDEHKGSVQVESKKGEGTMFIIHLPASSQQMLSSGGSTAGPARRRKWPWSK